MDSACGDMDHGMRIFQPSVEQAHSKIRSFCLACGNQASGRTSATNHVIRFIHPNTANDDPLAVECAKRSDTLPLFNDFHDSKGIGLVDAWQLVDFIAQHLSKMRNVLCTDRQKIIK